MEEEKKVVVSSSASMLILGTVVLIVLIAGIYGYFFLFENPEDSAQKVVAQSITHVGAATSSASMHRQQGVKGGNHAAVKKSEAKADMKRQAVTEVQKAKEPLDIILRLHGSNTIGAKLAPSLAVGYLTKIGVTDVKVIPTDHDNEVNVVGEKDGKRVGIEIHAHGSATAFQSFLKGTCDIGMASRAIKEKEVSELEFLGDMTSNACEHVIALDGIAVIVNQTNPIKKLTLTQIGEIFAGKITDWQELGAQPGEIHVYARDDRSGTFDTFKSLVLGKDAVKAKKRFESNAKLSDTVSEDPLGIGFTSLPNIRDSKALAVSDGDASIFPNFFTVATEDYSISRRLHLYTPANPQNRYTRSFINFTLGSAGQKIVAKNDLVDLEIKTFVSRVSRDQKVQNKKVFDAYLASVSGGKRLSLNFRFKRGGFELDNRANRDLERIVEFLKDTENQGSKIELIGFADNAGDYSYNYTLALKRAQTVAAEFEARGIPRVDVLSAGEEVPVASNDTQKGREKNRRVEVWLKSTDDSSQTLSIN